MTWLIVLLTWGLPFVILKGIADPWNEPKDLLWLVGCWGLIFLGLLQNRVLLHPCRNRWLGWLTAWVFLMGIATFYWPFLTRSPTATDIPYHIHQWLPTISVLTAVLTVRVISAWVSLPVHLAFLTRLLCWVALAIASYAVVQGLGIDQFYRANYATASPDHPMGVAFGNAGTTTMWLAMLLPLFFLLQGWQWMLGFLLCLGVILWVPQKSSWLVAGLGVGTYTFCRLWGHPWVTARHWVKKTLPVMAAMSLLFLGVQVSRTLVQDERHLAWSETIYQWRTSKSPWTGQGLQSFPAKFVRQFATLRPQTQVLDVRWMTPFNEWLQTLYELGLIGISLLGLTVWAWVRRGWQMADTVVGAGWFACGVACLTSSLIFFPFHYAPMAWLVMLVCAVMERSTEGVRG